MSPRISDLLTTQAKLIVELKDRIDKIHELLWCEAKKGDKMLLFIECHNDLRQYHEIFDADHELRESADQLMRQILLLIAEDTADAEKPTSLEQAEISVTPVEEKTGESKRTPFAVFGDDQPF